MSAERDTERRNPASRELDRLSLEDAFDLFQREDELAVRAIAAARAEVVQAIELCVARLSAGGRLFYVGAGTSGRLGVLDAAELPPTFQSDPLHVQGLIAGGPNALVRAIEGAEDARDGGRAALDEAGARAGDVVLGISAGGTTPFVHGALERARELGCASVFLACVPREQAGDAADVSIRLSTGPEVLTGSTRLKAGTVTKLVLNRISTLAMVRLGKVHENLMVDLDTRANKKLRARGVAVLRTLSGLDHEAAALLLERAGGRVKVAALMHARGLDERAAIARLAACDGFLRRALDAPR